MKFWIFLLLFFSLQGEPAQVLIIRHAEKPPEGEHLDQKGRERAFALAPFFLGRAEVLDFGLPVAIYAMGQNREDSSLRPQETVQEVAKALNLQPITRFKKGDEALMAEEILLNKEYHGKSILICWEHHSIQDIVKAFNFPEPPKWHGSVFDRVYKLILGNGSRAFYNLPQRLLFEDSPR